MRTSLERALDEVWSSVDHGTSPGAYLARRSKAPTLGAGATLPVTNGESVASTLRRTNLRGVVLAWQDVLHAGPLAPVAPPQLRELRARFLAELGWGDEAAIREELALRGELLARAVREGASIVLWFEHDLHDQLQLLQVLSSLVAAPPGQVELIQAHDYLGPLDAPTLEALAAHRQPVSLEAFELAEAVWRELCSGKVERALQRDLSPLPHLRAALVRLRQEREAPPRTKRQLLEALAEGPKTPPQAFAANQAKEEAVFLGDAWAYLYLYELWQEGLLAPVGRGILPLPPPRGDRSSFEAVALELTSAGRAAVSPSATSRV